MSYSAGLKPLSELERVAVRQAVVFMLALRGERKELGSLMRGAGVNFDYEVTNDLYEYRDVLMNLAPRFVVERESVGDDAFRVELLAGWEPRVEPGADYCFDAVVRVAELMLGREFDGWESEECKVGLLCSCGGVFMCPSRRRVIEFLKEAEAHTEFVGSESVVAVLSVIQDGLVCSDLPRPDGYDSEPYHKIWAWRGDAYIDGVLIPWACQRLGIWYEGDYELTKRVLSMSIEEEKMEEMEESESVAHYKIWAWNGNGEPVCEELGQVSVRAVGSAEEPAGTPGVSDTTTGVEVEAPKRRGWFRKLLGV